VSGEAADEVGVTGGVLVGREKWEWKWGGGTREKENREGVDLFGSVGPILGPWSGPFANCGETLRIVNTSDAYTRRARCVDATCSFGISHRFSFYGQRKERESHTTTLFLILSCHITI
jgi:hypothetical protein